MSRIPFIHPWGGLHHSPGQGSSCGRSPLLGRASALLESLRNFHKSGAAVSPRGSRRVLQHRGCSPSRLSLGRLCQGCASALSHVLDPESGAELGGAVTAHSVRPAPLQALFPKFYPFLGPHFSPPGQTPVWILQTAEKHFHYSC